MPIQALGQLNQWLQRIYDITNVPDWTAKGVGRRMPLKPRGRPRERTQGQRIGPMVDAELLREFDATAAKEGLSRNKALEEAMRKFVSARRQGNHRSVSDQS